MVSPMASQVRMLAPGWRGGRAVTPTTPLLLLRCCCRTRRRLSRRRDRSCQRRVRGYRRRGLLSYPGPSQKPRTYARRAAREDGTTAARRRLAAVDDAAVDRPHHDALQRLAPRASTPRAAARQRTAPEAEQQPTRQQKPCALQTPHPRRARATPRSWNPDCRPQLWTSDPTPCAAHSSTPDRTVRNSAEPTGSPRAAAPGPRRQLAIRQRSTGSAPRRAVVAVDSRSARNTHSSANSKESRRGAGSRGRVSTRAARGRGSTPSPRRGRATSDRRAARGTSGQQRQGCRWRQTHPRSLDDFRKLSGREAGARGVGQAQFGPTARVTAIPLINGSFRRAVFSAGT